MLNRVQQLLIEYQMTENKITMTIKPAENKKLPMIDGMIALKKIEHYAYALSDEIGLGFSSHVYRGKNEQNNELVAIKVIDLKKEDELSRQFMNEQINILQIIKARNPVNLLRLYDVFKTKNNLYIITEFCEGKDVAKLLRKKKRFSEGQAQSILRQLMNAYREIYQLNVVHRDLKLANVFIRKGVVKLADFGFAINSEKCQQKFDYNVGSPYYMPPQSLKFNRYSFKSDVWSFGIIAFEMVYGRLPWKEKVQSILFQKITNTVIDELFDTDVQLSDHYKHFIRACLQIDYDKRAPPEFIIGYEWPMAQQFVEGVEPDGSAGSSYKPLSMVKVPSNNNQPVTTSKTFTAHNIEEQSREDRRRSGQFGQLGQPLGQPIGQPLAQQQTMGQQPIGQQQIMGQQPIGQQQMGQQQIGPLSGQIGHFRERDRSPAHKNENKIINIYEQPIEKYKTVFREALPSNSKPVDLFKTTQSPMNKQIQVQSFMNSPVQASNNAELCILSQIYYCRFMTNLCDLLEQNNFVPDVQLLKQELVNKVKGKSEVLRRLRDGQNLLQVQGFNYYRSTERWIRLRDIIQKIDGKYKQKYPIDFKADTYDHVLVNTIKYLRSNIPNNFGLLEELTYFYQLKDLEKRQSLLNFAANSKLQLLSNRKPLAKQDPINHFLCERLNNKLLLLGF